MNNFLIKFNEITQNKYDYLRFKEAHLSEDKSTAIVTLIVPYEIYNSESFNLDVKADIFNACASIFSNQLKYKILFEQLAITKEVVKKFVTDFIIEQYLKVLEGHYIQDDIEITIFNNNVKVIIPIDEVFVSYCENKGFKSELITLLSDTIARDIEVDFKPVVFERKVDQAKNKGDILIDDGIVVMQKGIKVLGSPIASYPIYIAKYTQKKDIATVCGRVLNVNKKVSKTGKTFFTFTITDPTGELDCIYFSRNKGNKRSIFESIRPDDEVYLQGKLDLSNFNKKLILMVNTVYRCVIDWDSTQRKIDFVKSALLKTKVPIAKPYIEETVEEYTLLREQPYIAPILREKEFVVFDLETTGLDINNDKIVEIGACRVAHGQIVSTFSTLIDPQIPMPIAASEVNHITDYMLKDAPTIEYALPAFLKYCEGADIVGHNAVKFDYPFVKNKAEKLDLSFDYKCHDTMLMFRTYNPTAKSARLSECLKKYGIINANAHRALDDTIATAKLFINICNEQKLN